MKTKRKFTMMVTGLALALALMVGLTFTYLTDQRNVTNLLGIGVGTDSEGNVINAVQISLEEPSFAAKADAGTAKYLEEDKQKELTEAAMTGLLPGDFIYKDPTITNVGSEAVYLRVKIEMTAAQIQTLVDDLGLTINPQFVAGDTDDNGYQYYYYVGTGTECAEVASGAEVLFFNVTDDGEGMNYSMSIPATWTNADVKDFIGASGEKLISMPIVAQAIQARAYTPDGLSWDNAGHDIQEVELGDRNL